MNWKLRIWIRLFRIEYDTLQERKKSNAELELLKILKFLPIVAFFEAYDTFEDKFIGRANCPIEWVYHETAAVTMPASDQEVYQPFALEHVSVAS